MNFPLFDTYVCEGDTVELEIDGFTLTATVYRDDDSGAPDQEQDGFWPSLDPKDAGYIGPKSKSTLARHIARAKEVMQAWKDDEWFWCGVAVTVSKDGIQLTDDYAHACWGIGCNYPTFRKSDRANSYLSQFADDYIQEALQDAREIIARLAA